jgi:hypothetical protein
MATFLFWNINKHDLTNEIITLCHQYEVDILILAESTKINKIRFLERLNSGQLRKFVAPFNPSDYLSFYFKYPIDSVKPITDDGRISIPQISPPIGITILLVALHLPSKLYKSNEEQSLGVPRIMQTIQEAETKMGHTNTMVIGDFNMNPFETGLIAASCFHAVMDQQTAREQNRIVDGQSKKYFYNPMWGRMGDTSIGPPGTYYYRGSDISYFWNTFDQVLLRPNLLDYFSNEQLHIISKIGEKSLLDNKGKINKSISDHLPIIINLQLEKMV